MRYLPEPTVDATTMPNGELVLLQPRSGKLYQGNQTSAAMWAALAHHGGDLDAAADLVAQTFKADIAQVRADLLLLLEELMRAGVVRAEP